MNALMIINPVSGKMVLSKHYTDIISIFKEAGYSLDVRCTTGKDSAREIIKKCAPDCDIIICCGGDGTLNDIINGVMECGEDIAIGYIPCGTTNDFASSIGLSKNVITAARDIVSGEATQVDVGKFGDTYFSYVASFGAFTQSSYNTPQNMKNTFGHLAYVVEGVKELPYLKPTALRITTETGVVHNGEYVLGAIANTTSIGGIIKLDSAYVDLSDGEFEVLLIHYPKNIMDLNNIITSLNTNDYENPSISFFRARELTVESKEKILWSVDGECFGAREKEVIKNYNKSIKIILPKK